MLETAGSLLDVKVDEARDKKSVVEENHKLRIQLPYSETSVFHSNNGGPPSMR